MSIDIESIHGDMLMGLSDEYQKSPGYPAYDFTRAFAFACASLGDDIDMAESHLDIYNLTGEELETFVYQHRGLSRKEGNKATATIEIVYGSGTVTEGDLFATKSGVVFASTETKTVEDGDTFEVEAVEAGTNGNVAANTITQVPSTIPGINSFTNTEPASGGTPDESDSDLLARFLDNLQYPDNGSNAQAYINWATSVDGVGRAKCFPLEGGPGTVTVCITGTDMGAPTQDIIDAVQDYIDPGASGTGEGRAPVGAACTVTGATAVSINISATLVIASGYVAADVKAAVEAAFGVYLKDIAFKRIDINTYQTYVSYAKIGECIMDTDGVLDYSSLTVNSGTASVQLEDDEVPVLGTVTLT